MQRRHVDLAAAEAGWRDVLRQAEAVQNKMIPVFVLVNLAMALAPKLGMSLDGSAGP